MLEQKQITTNIVLLMYYAKVFMSQYALLSKNIEHQVELFIFCLYFLKQSRNFEADTIEYRLCPKCRAYIFKFAAMNNYWTVLN